MPNRGPDDELIAAALAHTKQCPPLEELERLLSERAPASLKQHLDGCPHCQTELHALRSFTSNEVAAQERAAVDAIAVRLKAGSPPIAARPAAAFQEPQSWWKRILVVNWLPPVAATLAVALVVAGVAIGLRQGRRPSLDTRSGGTEVLRSSAIAILSPMGDLQQRPTEIRWEAVPNAAQYRVRLMEVDHAELWSGETTSSRIELPPRVESLIVPAKTLLLQIGAFDAAGRMVAESEITRFRLLQKVYRQ